MYAATDCYIVHLEKPLKRPHPDYQLVSLISHLFKRNWQNTLITFQRMKEASGDPCCEFNPVGAHWMIPIRTIRLQY